MKHFTRIGWLLSFAAIAVATITYYAYADSAVIDLFIFNTDLLIIPDIYQDIFVEGNSLRYWHLTPAPYFFPDMFLYFPIRWLTGDYRLAQFVFSLVQLILISYLSYVSLRLSGIDKSQARTIHAFCNLCLCLLIGTPLVTGNYFLSHFFLSISNHTGNMINLFLVLNLYLLYQQQKKIYQLLLLLFMTLVAWLSDRLILPTLLIPIILTESIRFIRTRSLSSVWITLTLVVSGIAAQLLNNVIRKDWVYIPKPEKVTYGNKSESASRLFRMLAERVQFHNWLETVWTLLVLAGIFLLLYGLWKDRKKSTFYLYLIILSSVCITAWMAVLTGLIQSIDTYRYLIYGEYWIICGAACVVFNSVQTSWKRTALFFAPVLILGIYQLPRFSYSGFRAYLQFKHPDLATFEGRNLKQGVGHYWNSKLISFSSGHQIKVRPVIEGSGLPNLHETSRTMYYRTDSQLVFNFFYLVHPPPELPVLDSASNIHGWLYITPAFYYERTENGFVIRPVSQK